MRARKKHPAGAADDDKKVKEKAAGRKIPANDRAKERCFAVGEVVAHPERGNGVVHELVLLDNGMGVEVVVQHANGEIHGYLPKSQKKLRKVKEEEENEENEGSPGDDARIGAQQRNV